MRHPAPLEGTDVDQATTTQGLRIRFLHGWFVSFVLHGLFLFSFLPLFRQSVITTHHEPFHWDVTLVQTIPTAHESIQTADVLQPAVPKQPDRTPTISHVNRTIRHAAPSAERITSRAPKTEAPVTSPREVATTSTPNELPSTLDQTTESPRQQTEPPMDSTASTPSLETAAAVVSEGSTPTTEAAQPSPAPATTSDVAAVSAIRPDYSWLQQAIFRRLEELKRSSPPSLDESRPLKVTVKAVVSREGNLLDSAVVKSSGFDRIDQEAMALVQQAFPLQLDRSLDRGQIVMRIPITYSRE
jgi:TonB family protein